MPVELISITIRPISLAVRMFANLVMGHIMIARLNFVIVYPYSRWQVWLGVSIILSSYSYLFELIVFIAQNMIFLYLYTIFFYYIKKQQLSNRSIIVYVIAENGVMRIIHIFYP